MVRNNRFYSRKEIILLAIFFIAGFFSLIFFFKYKQQAFPEDNIHFTITNNQAGAKSENFLHNIGVNSQGYKQVTVFTIDDAAKTYVERETNVTVASNLSQNTIALWDFDTRFFKPLTKEEYLVSFLPNGRLSGYKRIIDENTKGATLSQDGAQKVAEQFLFKQLHTSLNSWNLIDTNSLSRAHRIDYTFIYEKKNFSIHGATYRMTVTVYGDQIGGYAEQLHIPEDWTRQYEQERSQNDLAQTIAEFVAFLLFGVTSLIFFVIQFRNSQLRIRLGLLIGLVTFSVSFIAYLNALPLAFFGYDTTQSWTAFLGELILGSAFEGIIPAAISGFIVIVGEYFYRRTFRDKIALEHFLSKGVRTKEVNKALLIGSLYGIITFAYIVAFYMFGKRYGFWSPAEVNYSDAFSTYIPWIYPLYIGISAAVLEEGIFRLFGIPFLMKFVKKAWIAVLITAFSWSFLHSNYPQSPWFVRGIEVGIEGVVLGFLYLRFGILASFSAHFTFDALTTAVALWSPEHLVNSLISIVLSLLLLILAISLLILALYKKGFKEDVSQIINNALQSIVTAKNKIPLPPIDTIRTTYKQFLSKKTGFMIGGLIVLSVFGMVIATFHLSFNTANQAIITRQEALDRAKNILITKSINPSDYINVVKYVPSAPSTTEQRYLLTYADSSLLSKLYPNQIPLALWRVRFFKSLTKNEYNVYLRPDGSFYSLTYILNEDEKGKTLTKDEAVQVAITSLQKEYHQTMSDYTLVGSTSQKRPQRTDYAFTFEQNEDIAGEAVTHIEIDILGDKPSGYTKSIKLPDDFVRQDQQTTTTDFIFGLFSLLSFIALCIYGLIIFFSFVKKKSIPFKQASIIALPFLTFWILEKINDLPLFYENYDTSIPLQTYIFEHIGGLIVSFILFALIIPLMVSFFLTLWRKHIGEFIPRDITTIKRVVIDGLFLGYTSPIIILGIVTIYGVIQIHYQLLSPIFADAVPGIDHFFPAIDIVGSVLSTFLATIFLAILVLLLKNVFKSTRTIIAILSIVTIASSVELAVKSAVSFEIGTIAILLNLLFLLITYSACRYVLRNNIFAYLTSMSTTILLFQSLSLFEINDILLGLNFIVILLIATLPFSALLFLSKIQKIKSI